MTDRTHLHAAAARLAGPWVRKGHQLSTHRVHDDVLLAAPARSATSSAPGAESSGSYVFDERSSPSAPIVPHSAASCSGTRRAAAVERAHILRTLARHDNEIRAGRASGFTRTTLHVTLRESGVERVAD